MERIISFLKDLAENNNREWFLAHKTEYTACKKAFEAFTLQLIDGIRAFDPSIGPLSVKDCTYRIYRDVRFSADKSPYKIQMGAFIAPEGKKSGYSGYYFQMGAYDKGYPGGCMLATGNYYCEPKVLKILREDLSMDTEGYFTRALQEASDFKLDFDGALRRVPAGFPADHPYNDFLRLKSFCLIKEPGMDYMLASDLLERVVSDFKHTKPFLDFINRAIVYTKEQEKGL